MPYLKLKKIAKLIPYVGSFIIFCGILKLSIYYKGFNIAINDYLELSELLTSFASDITFYTILFVVLGVLFYLAEEIEETIKINGLIEKAMRENSLIKRLKLYTTAFKTIPFFLLIIISTSILYFFKKIDLYLTVLFLISMFITLTIPLLLFEIEKKYLTLSGERFDPSFKQIVSLLLLLVFIVITSSFIEIHDVKKNKKYIGTKFQIDESIMTSDAQNYYIGKTNKFLFFYKSQANETIVYPMYRIKMISFQRKIK